MFGLWYWLPVLITAIIILLAIVGIIGQIAFVALYGEKIRSIILNLPGYTPKWFTFVDFSKPTKPWDIIGVFFFVSRVTGAVFTKKSSIVNESFKKLLPTRIIDYLKWLRFIRYIFLMLLIFLWVALHFQRS